MSDATKVYELFDEAYGLPHGPVRVAIYMDAVRVADEVGDDELRFRARRNLYDTAGFSGADEQALVAFGWCLNKYREDPERYRTYARSLCWEFKHIVGTVIGLPQISLEQVEALMQDMQSLYAMHNYNFREIDCRRYRLAKARGLKEEALEYYHKYKSQDRDSISDCRTCERSAEVAYYCYIGEREKAIQHAQPLLRGEMTCFSIPKATYCWMLRTFALTNRLEEADQMQAKGYRLVRSNPHFLCQIGDQLSYLSFRGKLQMGVNMFARHLEWALVTFDLEDKFYFLMAAKWLFEELESAASSGRKPTRKLNLPREFPLLEPQGEYRISDILSWLNTEARQIAERFDKRNGTSAYMDEYNEGYRYKVGD